MCALREIFGRFRLGAKGWKSGLVLRVNQSLGRVEFLATTHNFNWDSVPRFASAGVDQSLNFRVSMQQI